MTKFFFLLFFWWGAMYVGKNKGAKRRDAWHPEIIVILHFPLLRFIIILSFVKNVFIAIFYIFFYKYT